MTETFAFYISVLRKEFTKYCSETLSELNVTYGQLFILIFLGKKEKCSPKTLSTILKLDAGQLNRTILTLTKNGFLIQEKNQQDRRANILSLTDKGKQVFEMSHNLFYQWDEGALAPLSAAERQELLKLVKKIVFSKSNINPT